MWKVLGKCDAYNQKKKQCNLFLNKRYELFSYKRDSLLKNSNPWCLQTQKQIQKLKMGTQKTGVINQFHNVIKYTIIITRSCEVLPCSYLAEDWYSEY